MFVICDGLYRTLASHSQAAVQFNGDETGQKRPDGRDGTRARRAKWRSQLFGKAGEMSQLHLSLSLQLAAGLRLRSVVVRGGMIASVQPPRRNGERARPLLPPHCRGPGCIRCPARPSREGERQDQVPGPAPASQPSSQRRVCPVNGQRPPRVRSHDCCCRVLVVYSSSSPSTRRREISDRCLPPSARGGAKLGRCTVRAGHETVLTSRHARFLASRTVVWWSGGA